MFSLGISQLLCDATIYTNNNIFFIVLLYIWTFRFHLSARKLMKTISYYRSVRRIRVLRDEVDTSVLGISLLKTIRKTTYDKKKS